MANSLRGVCLLLSYIVVGEGERDTRGLDSTRHTSASIGLYSLSSSWYSPRPMCIYRLYISGLFIAILTSASLFTGHVVAHGRSYSHNGKTKIELRGWAQWCTACVTAEQVREVSTSITTAFLTCRL